MDFSITGLQFGAGILMLGAFIIGVILFLKYRIASTTITPKNTNRLTKKYAEVDIFKSSGTFWRIGLVSAVFVAVLAFSWTTYEESFSLGDYDINFDDFMEEIPSTTNDLPLPPPPPPPPPPVIETTEEVVKETPKFTDQTVTDKVSNKVETLTPTKPTAIKRVLPTKPTVKEPEIEKVLYIVEEMPRFPGCDEAGNYEAQKACADKKMLEFIYKNIKYPTIARDNGIEGTAVVSFVVEKDGSITDIKIVRDPGAGCGEESLRVVALMNRLPQKWVPGQQGNENVRVQFNLPIRFRLEK